jgi:hypothetical protein
VHARTHARTRMAKDIIPPSHENVSERPYRWFVGTTVDELYLDGGGALGVAYAEFMHALEEGVARNPKRVRDPAGRLKRCSGSSIGALVAFAIVVGVHPRALHEQMGQMERMEQIMQMDNIEVSAMRNGAGCRAGFVSGTCGRRAGSNAKPEIRLPLSYATDAIREGIAFVIRVCTAENGIPPAELTMADAEAVLGIELVVAVTVNHGRGPHSGTAHVIALSSRVHPTLLVRDAMHASMGIPGVIHPLLYHGRYLADGSFGREHPARTIHCSMRRPYGPNQRGRPDRLQRALRSGAEGIRAMFGRSSGAAAPGGRGISPVSRGSMARGGKRATGPVREGGGGEITGSGVLICHKI